MAKPTLIEIAQSSRIIRAKRATKEEIDLAIAWALGEVPISGVALALLGNKKSHTNAFFYMAVWLRQAVLEERLVVSK